MLNKVSKEIQYENLYNIIINKILIDNRISLFIKRAHSCMKIYKEWGNF